MKVVSEAEKPIIETKMKQTLADITDQALSYYDNNAKGSEEQKNKIRNDLISVMENETSRVTLHNHERLQLQKERATSGAVKVRLSKEYEDSCTRK